MTNEECEISAVALCKLAGLTYIASKVEDDGSVTIRFNSDAKPPKPKPDDDEDSGF